MLLKLLHCSVAKNISADNFLFLKNMFSSGRTLRSHKNKIEGENLEKSDKPNIQVKSSKLKNSAKSGSSNALSSEIKVVKEESEANDSVPELSKKTEEIIVVTAKSENKGVRKKNKNTVNESKVSNIAESQENQTKCKDSVEDISDVVPIVKKSKKKVIAAKDKGAIAMLNEPSMNEDIVAKSPRKRKIITNIEDKEMEKQLKTEGLVKQKIVDIEEAHWEPDNWKEVWENILKMRKMHVAPVDSLGCEECPEKESSPEVFRYQTLISVMLSSQTRDEVTYAATQRLIHHGLNIDNILNTSDEKIGELIYPAGFWKSKVQFIKKTTLILKNEYNGDIPSTLKELCKLPGVGPKMANIVMSVGWNNTVGIAVDTHVHRISNRLGWVKKPTKDPEHTRKALEAWLPKDIWRPVNVTLVGFGQTICKPIGPSCNECLNRSLCPFGRSSEKSIKKKPKKKSL